MSRQGLRLFRRPNIHWFWASFFGLWIFLLSGLLTHVTGSPGILHSMQIQSLLAAKQNQVIEAESQITQLQNELKDLQKSPRAQSREIRQVLGYLAPDEIVFEFEH